MAQVKKLILILISYLGIKIWPQKLELWLSYSENKYFSSIQIGMLKKIFTHLKPFFIYHLFQQNMKLFSILLIQP